ncbi:hybrid sensor histidine kinase/response regulator [Limnoglobus roseus]|uniref:histidine kinase n=1 Tax=Limnoglobus roseus TaxID=2598579 RepID=A0A5C1ACU5_9BACT|nr:hybrid sensor histidine kinase/response regulator [Limnoglobus roseus]QEL16465.1 hybrid sensor histidine kinase/response regulator [Limnoglobus roseus]
MVKLIPTGGAGPSGLRLLLVDDDSDDYLLTRELVEELPGSRFSLDWVDDFDEAVRAIGRGEHDVYLIDYRLGAKTGLELIAALKGQKCSGPIILLTGQGQFEIDQAAHEAGASDYLEKSALNAVTLERTIRYALKQYAHEAELERKVQERTKELEDANAALRDADRRKDEFLATLAHELRNPLAPIRNALEIQRMATNNPTTLESARQMIERQVRQLVRLIDDLLDASRMTRDKLRLELETLDLIEPLEIAIETSQPLLAQASVTFERHIPAESMRLRGDRVRLAQLFANLLNNAAKYTEAGGRVTLSVEKADGSAVVRVKDTGVGIPPELIPRLFELFAQFNRSLHRSQGGLGIGLALVRRLVQMHGGSISAVSKGLGHGSEFTVKLPMLPAS